MIARKQKLVDKTEHQEDTHDYDQYDNQNYEISEDYKQEAVAASSSLLVNDFDEDNTVNDKEDKEILNENKTEPQDMLQETTAHCDESDLDEVVEDALMVGDLGNNENHTSDAAESEKEPSNEKTLDKQDTSDEEMTERVEYEKLESGTELSDAEKTDKNNSHEEQSGKPESDRELSENETAGNELPDAEDETARYDDDGVDKETVQTEDGIATERTPINGGTVDDNNTDGDSESEAEVIDDVTAEEQVQEHGESGGQEQEGQTTDEKADEKNGDEQIETVDENEQEPSRDENHSEPVGQPVGQVADECRNDEGSVDDGERAEASMANPNKDDVDDIINEGTDEEDESESQDQVTDDVIVAVSGDDDGRDVSSNDAVGMEGEENGDEEEVAEGERNEQTVVNGDVPDAEFNRDYSPDQVNLMSLWKFACT